MFVADFPPFLQVLFLTTPGALRSWGDLTSQTTIRLEAKTPKTQFHELQSDLLQKGNETQSAAREKLACQVTSYWPRRHTKKKGLPASFKGQTQQTKYCHSFTSASRMQRIKTDITEPPPSIPLLLQQQQHNYIVAAFMKPIIKVKKTVL